MEKIPRKLALLSSAQETPIFGSAHHLTNTRVKISMMARVKMRRMICTKKSADVCSCWILVKFFREGPMETIKVLDKPPRFF